MKRSLTKKKRRKGWIGMNWIGGRPLKIGNRRGGTLRNLEEIGRIDGINRIDPITECLPILINEGLDWDELDRRAAIEDRKSTRRDTEESRRDRQNRRNQSYRSNNRMSPHSNKRRRY